METKIEKLIMEKEQLGIYIDRIREVIEYLDAVYPKLVKHHDMIELLLDDLKSE